MHIYIMYIHTYVNNVFNFDTFWLWDLHIEVVEAVCQLHHPPSL